MGQNSVLIRSRAVCRLGYTKPRRGQLYVVPHGWYYFDPVMTEEVLVTRKGQTTIPARLREKYSIREGTRLEVTDAGSGILFKRKPNTVDLAGKGSKHSTPREMKILLDKMREEDA